MKKNTKILIIFLTISFLAIGFFYNNNLSNNNLTKQNNDVVTLVSNNISIVVDIADDISEQRFGLSGRISLPSNNGMLFIFKGDDFHGIWMKDMLFPIDIIWLDKDLTVVDFELNVSPDTFPEVFKPYVRSRYVLEVNAGFVNKHDIEIGNNFYFLE